MTRHRVSHLLAAFALALTAACDRTVEPETPVDAVNVPRARYVTSTSPFGVQVHLFDSPGYPGNAPFNPVFIHDTSYFSLTNRAGIKWIRISISRNMLVDDNGAPVYSGVELDRLNYTLAIAAQNGWGVLANMMDAQVAWPNPTLWTSFFNEAVGRYGAQVKYWEIWNEPNATTFLRRSPGDTNPVTGGEYAELITSVAPIVHGHSDPSKRGYIVGGAIAGQPFAGVVCDTVPECARNELLFMQEMLDAASGSIDVVSLHNYRDHAWEMNNDITQAEGLLINGSYPQRLWLTEAARNGWKPASDTVWYAEMISALTQRASYAFLTSAPLERIFTWHLFEQSNGDGQGMLKPTLGAGTANDPFHTPRPTRMYWAYLKGALNCSLDGTCVPNCQDLCSGVARWHANGNGAHFYSTNQSEVDNIPWAWTKDRTNAFYVDNQNFGGARLTPLYQCWSQPAHMLTHSANCDGLPDMYFDRLLGYTSADSGTGMRPLYRLYRAFDSDWYSTTCESERQMLQATGYANETFLGYVWPGTCPPDVQGVYRLYHPYATTHVYTTDWNELNGAPDWQRLPQNSSYFSVRSWPQYPHTRPLYQCWSFPAHVLTLDQGCDGRPGASLDRTLGFISPYSWVGPALRLMKKTWANGDIDYHTVCQADRAAALSAGFVDDPITPTLGYVPASTYCH